MTFAGWTFDEYGLEDLKNPNSIAAATATYSDMDDLIEVCIPHMASQGFTEEQTRDYMKQLLPTLNYWKKYEQLGDNGEFEEFKKQLIEEINIWHGR